MKQMTVTIIGAGLAGSEAAWQLANQRIHVRLYEMETIMHDTSPSKAFRTSLQ